jgi:eukaryotic-like serine/threonine-protein kinase
LWSKGSDQADAAPVPGTEGGIAPTFSPDGAWIAFLADGKLRKVPRQGGSAVTLADSGAVPSTIQAVEWMANGTIAFTTESFGMAIAPQDGGTVRRFTWLDTLAFGVVSIAGVSNGDALLLTLCGFGCTEPQLYQLEPETGRLREVVGEALRAWELPDGRVAFVRRDGGVFVGRYDVGRAAFRSPPVPVLDGVRTAATGADIAIASGGTLLYVPGESQEGGVPLELVWVMRDGSSRVVDSGWAYAPAANGGASLSPDGRRVAVAARASGSDDIWIKELDHGAFTRLTFEGGNARPQWSADGRYVMYMSASESATNGDLYRRRADGTSVAELLINHRRGVWEVANTPDTSRLLVRIGVPPSRDIMLLERGGGGPDTALTPLLADDRYEEVRPTISPDGRWLAYSTNESGRYEIYVRPWPNVADGRWQVSRDGGIDPAWAHSGRELFYRNGLGQLEAAQVVAGTGFSTGEYRVLFNASGFVMNSASHNYDVAPDDQRFLFARLVGTGDSGGNVARTAVLIQNWLSQPQVAGK